MKAPYHMRRDDRRIADPIEVDRILRQGRFVVLALARENEPYVVTLSYGFDDAARVLYFHVAHEGLKLDFIAANPRACATVVLDGGYVTGECEHAFESVVMRGIVRRVETADEKAHAIHTLVNHLEDDPSGYWRSRRWRLEQRIDGFTALAFEIESLDAKRGT